MALFLMGEDVMSHFFTPILETENVSVPTHGKELKEEALQVKHYKYNCKFISCIVNYKLKTQDVT